MKSISYLSLILTFLLVLVSCKKDSSEKDLTPKGILISQGWKLTSITYGPLITDRTTLFAVNCQLDDCSVFNSDGTYKFTTGNIKCDSSDADKTGTWTMSEDGRSLFTSMTSIKYTIVSISKTSMVLKYELNSYSYYSWEYTYIPCI